MNLVILSDYGLDDAVALAHILGRRSMFGAIDVLAVAGNVSAENSLLNAKKLLSNFDGPTEGVRLVDTSGIAQPWSYLPSIHGEDGMGDLFGIKSLSVPVISYNEWLADADRPFTVLSLGPCTLTLDVIEKTGEHPLVIMGGLTKAEPNYKGYEFNHELDKQAFAQTVRHPHVIATLDTCRAPQFNMIKKRTDGKAVIDRLINRAIELAAARHPDNCYIYDYVAAQYLTSPEKFAAHKVKDPWGNTLNELKVTDGGN